MSDVPPSRSKWRRALPLIASALAIVIGVLLIARPAFLSSVPTAPKPALQVGHAEPHAQSRRGDPRF